MRRLLRRFDRLLRAAADAILAWSAARVEASHQPWVDALRGELEVVPGGPAQLLWALGGLSLAFTARRRSLHRSWTSLPTLLRTGAFGLALSAVLVVGIVWSNVIVPSHESDDEYTAWYIAFYLGLLGYFFLAGFFAEGRPDRVISGAITGAVTAVLFALIVLTTFAVIDNLFLDVVMQQPDKANGFARSGMTSQRDYVNQGLLLGTVLVTMVLGAFGAAMGALGGLVRQRISGGRRSEPAAV